MKRRTITLLPLGLALAAAFSISAQTQRVVHIAWPASVPIHQWPMYAVFVEAMRERGWVEGTHYIVDAASYGGQVERIPAAVADALARKPDLIIGSGTPAMRALMAAKTSLPIVMFGAASPVEQGFVTSLSRPGGNVTGIVAPDEGLLGKQFEMLLRAAPAARRIGVAYNPDIPSHLLGLRDVEAAALRRGLHVRPVTMRSSAEIGATVEALQRERVDAVHFFLQPWLVTGDVASLAAIAVQHRWPTALALPPQAQAGILLTYGFRQEDQLRRLAYYVDRILKGTPPGDLPVEQPTRIYLALNLKTARALGLTLPQSLLAMADEVVE
jgi:putative tryptophan/tyrosine transport system substrate-binding protein